MAEEPQQVTTKELQQVQQELQQVTTKNPKKGEAGKRLAAHNCRRREEQRKEQAKLEKTTSGVNQYYGFSAILALGVIGGLGYYIYQSRKRQVPNNPTQQPHPQVLLQTNKFEMD